MLGPLLARPVPGPWLRSPELVPAMPDPVAGHPPEEAAAQLEAARQVSLSVLVGVLPVSPLLLAAAQHLLGELRTGAVAPPVRAAPVDHEAL